MYLKTPFLSGQSPFFKVLILILIIIFSTLMTFFLGLLAGIPFFGTEVFDQMIKMSNDISGSNVVLMKYIQVINQIGVFILPSFFFAFLSAKSIGSYLGFDRRPALISGLITIALIFTILPFSHWLMNLNADLHLPGFLNRVEEWMKRSEEKTALLTEVFLNTTSIRGLISNLVIVAFMAALGEELLFRPVMIRVFNEWFRNIHLAVIVSAVVFSSFHLQFYGFLPRFMLGIIFGYLFVWSGSFWLPFLAHFVNNASAVMLYFLFKADTIHTDAEQFGATENIFWILASAISVVIIMILIYRIETGQKKHCQKLSIGK